MADCSVSLEDLLVDLSMNDDCLGSIKDTKKHDCSLNALWSEDDSSVVQDSSLNITNICSMYLSFDETEDFQHPQLFSSNNVTVRRKTKKKRHISKDNKSDKRNKCGLDLGSPFLNDINNSSRCYDVPVHEQNTESGSLSLADDRNMQVCRKLSSEFEQTDKSSTPDVNLYDGALDECAQQMPENTRDSACDETKLVDCEYESETNSQFEHVSIEVKPEHDELSSVATGEHLSWEAVNQSSENCLSGSQEDNYITDISMNSFSYLTNNQSQNELDKVVEKFICANAVERRSNGDCVVKDRESVDSHQDQGQSNMNSDIVAVSPAVERNIDPSPNVFQPNRINAFEQCCISTLAEGNNSNTSQDQSLTCPKVKDDKKCFVGSNIDKSKISYKRFSHPRNVEQSMSNAMIDDSRFVYSEEHSGSIGLSENDVPQPNVNNTDPLLTNLQVKDPTITDKAKETPAIMCQLNTKGNIADRTDKRLSNEESVCRTAKETVFVLSSESEYDSVWEDAPESDDSDCREYNIELASHFDSDPGYKAIEEMNTKPGRSTSSAKDSTLLVRNLEFSESSDDDDEFEQFLGKLKTPKPKSTPRISLKSFIVDDFQIDSSEDEDRVIHSLKTPISITPTTSQVSLPVKNTQKAKTTPFKINTKDNSQTCKSIKRIVTPYVNTPHKAWRKSRDLLVDELFKCYNETVFDNNLPVDLPISWNKQMTKTAGICYYLGSIHKKCRIELSDKVVDSCDRIRDTLIHELCHAATWLIDGVKAGHGPHWKRWAHKARMVHSDLPPISRCHSYDINYKFTYKCVKCHHSFGRHSKSVNLKTAGCPYCLSHLELLPRLNKDGTPAKTRAPTKFSLFVKDNYGKIKASAPRCSHQEIMKELSKQFAQQVVLDKENGMKTCKGI